MGCDCAGEGGLDSGGRIEMGGVGGNDFKGKGCRGDIGHVGSAVESDIVHNRHEWDGMSSGGRGVGGVSQGGYTNEIRHYDYRGREIPLNYTRPGDIIGNYSSYKLRTDHTDYSIGDIENRGYQSFWKKSKLSGLQTISF